MVVRQEEGMVSGVVRAKTAGTLPLPADSDWHPEEQKLFIELEPTIVVGLRVMLSAMYRAVLTLPTNPEVPRKGKLMFLIVNPW